MDHVAGPLHSSLAKKEGRIWFSIIYLKLYEFERITWWCFFVLEYVLESVMEHVMESTLQYDLLEEEKN